MKYWKGYSLHIDSAEGGIPVSCLLTSASLHDSQVAIPLAEESSSRVTYLYELMDAAYDCAEIKAFSKGLGHVAIIDENPRTSARKKEIAVEAKARRHVNLQLPEEVRYNERSNAERVNSRLKDEFGGRSVRVRGHAKVACHLMFGILVIAADGLLNLVR